MGGEHDEEELAAYHPTSTKLPKGKRMRRHRIERRDEEPEPHQDGNVAADDEEEGVYAYENDVEQA